MGLGWAQPLEYFANLDPLNALIFSFWRLKKPNLKGCIVKTNEDSKLLLFYLIFGGVGGYCVFYLSAWSTTLMCLIVGR